jgi:hypothetical protein
VFHPNILNPSCATAARGEGIAVENVSARFPNSEANNSSIFSSCHLFAIVGGRHWNHEICHLLVHLVAAKLLYVRRALTDIEASVPYLPLLALSVYLLLHLLARL